MSQPSFSINDHVYLAPLTIADSEAILHLVNINRDYLSPYLYWVENVVDKASAKDYIEQRANSGLPSAAWYKVMVNEQLSGVFAIKEVRAQQQVAELGYWLAKQVQGKGVLTSILSRLPELLANSLVNCIEFRVLNQNQASMNVALKAGAVHVDTKTNYMKMNETMQDLLVFQLPLSTLQAHN